MEPSARSSGGSVAKRLLLGRAFSSSRLEHTLLPKLLALPVFASDALSSVAYATGEILIALSLVTSEPQPYVMPIAIAIALLMGVVVMSYRQTVRAYPGGGGAYIVSKENLGVPAGLVAAAALLFDYMMTVVVSVVAGVFAIGSAFPAANEHAVPLSIGFVTLVTLLNLRGSKESGTLFAIPTYGFVVAITALIVIGLARCLTGCPSVGVEVEPLEHAATTVGTVGLFALLKAFSSGATALTGVEAISNGVPAFKRPQARNAAATLAIMGAIAVTMFLGISWLATHIDGIVASDQRSVVAQIAIAVFGEGGVGFFLVQAFTSLILILAANTAYQDFPRLASILARDGFMPSQFVNRGDRLVFSNGVLVLGLLSSVMIWIFDASLTSLIHLYVVGVFTSFTLSQAGMIRHWIAEGRKGPAAMRGWRISIVINAIGCVVTGVVLLVVIWSKFADGAWLSMLIMAILVPAFYGIHRHYAWAGIQLDRGLERSRTIGDEHVVLLLTDLTAASAAALGYIKSFRPDHVRVVIPTGGAPVPDRLRSQWRAFAGLDAPELEPLGDGSLTASMRRCIRNLERGPDDIVTVVIPEIVQEGLLTYLIRRRSLVRLKATLLREGDVAITNVPIAIPKGQPVGAGRALIPPRTVSLVFVSTVNDLAVRAVNHAAALDAPVTRAIYFETDPEKALDLERAWFDIGAQIPLDIVEAPFRDLTTPMLEEVRRYSSREDTIVNVIVPEFIVTKWWQLPLHNQNALFIKRLFLREPRVVLTSVPLVAGRGRAGQSAGPSPVASTEESSAP